MLGGTFIAGANRSENVAAFASRAAESAAEINDEDPIVASATSNEPKIRLRIQPSFRGDNGSQHRIALFQHRFMRWPKWLHEEGVVGQNGAELPRPLSTAVRNGKENRRLQGRGGFIGA